MIKNIHYIFLIAFTGKIVAQIPDTFSLSQILHINQQNNIGIKEAGMNFAIAKCNFELFKSSLLPQITLKGQLPNFTRSSDAVIQSDGRINFRPIRYDNSFLIMDVEQAMPWTGGSLNLTSNFQRFRDVENKASQFNTIPFRLGLSQSIGGYNAFKWNSKIEALLWEESQKIYTADLEAAQATAIAAFFDALINSKRHESALFIQSNAGEILDIAKEKYALGRLSKNELLQLQLNEKNADNVVSQSQRQLIVSLANLYAILNLPYQGEIKHPSEPPPIGLTSINIADALEQARLHRAEIISFNRQIWQQQSLLEKAKRDHGPQLVVNTSFGLFRSAQAFKNLFDELQQDQLLSVGLTIPILQWGKRKLNIAKARASLEFEKARVANELQTIESNLVVEVILFDQLSNELENTREINMIAQERFQIAKESFVLGSLSVTDLFISQREQDDAANAYINTLSEYWNSYFGIRAQTLYDFEQMRPLNFLNTYNH